MQWYVVENVNNCHAATHSELEDVTDVICKDKPGGLHAIPEHLAHRGWSNHEGVPGITLERLWLTLRSTEESDLWHHEH
jgi:hypothetical protein